jgi:hypothetical protein
MWLISVGFVHFKMIGLVKEIPSEKASPLWSNIFACTTFGAKEIL